MEHRRCHAYGAHRVGRRAAERQVLRRWRLRRNQRLRSVRRRHGHVEATRCAAGRSVASTLRLRRLAARSTSRAGAASRPMRTM
jgi:hypothetical protein